MDKFIIGFFCVIFVALIADVYGSPDGVPGPPRRPPVFSSPEELKDYLQALNEYFAIVGRPRFGRSVNKRSAYRRSNAEESLFE